MKTKRLYYLFANVLFINVYGQFLKIDNSSVWKDIQGNEIKSQGGGMILYKDTFHWYGMGFGSKSSDKPEWVVNHYTSIDLKNWIKQTPAISPRPDIPFPATGSWVGRPWVLHNPNNDSFVMVIECKPIGTTGSRNKIGFLTSNSLYGPWKYRPEKLIQMLKDASSKEYTMGDLGAYSEGNNAWLLYTFDKIHTNRSQAIAKLDKDFMTLLPPIEGNYVEFNQTADSKYGFEAAGIFKRKGVYYYMVSETQGWNSSRTHYRTSRNMAGPWTDLIVVETNPTINLNSFNTQHDFTLSIAGSEDTTIVYFGDRYSNRIFDVTTDFLKPIDVGRVGWYPISFIPPRGGIQNEDIPVINAPTYDKDFGDWSIDVKKGKWQYDGVDCNGTQSGLAYLDPCNRCIGGSTLNTVCSTLAEVEDLCTVNGILETTSIPFKGKGYINIKDSIGSKVSFKIMVNSATDVVLMLSYASIKTYTAQLFLNNNIQSDLLNFENTGALNAWKNLEIKLSLIADTNNIAIVANTSDGLPNFDQIATITYGLTLGDCKFDCLKIEDGTAIIDKCGFCVGGLTGKNSCSLAYQPDQACSFNGVIEYSINGYLGNGYLTFNESEKSQITLSIDALESTLGTFVIRYLTSLEKEASLTINDIKQSSNIVFPVSNYWTTKEIKVNLVKGNNLMILKATSASGLPNIDQFSFNEEGLNKGNCNTYTVVKSLENNLRISPNPSNTSFYLKEQIYPSYITIYNLFGIVVEKKIIEGELIFGSKYPNGVYIVEIENIKGKSFVKITKH